MNKNFKTISSQNEFDAKLANLFSSSLIVLNESYSESLRKITFTSSQTETCTSSFDYKKSREMSLQRRLLNTALSRLKPLFFPATRVIDIAGGGYGDFFGIAKNNYHVLNIRKTVETTYVGDADSELEYVPSESYDAALCLNYLLLSKDPAQVVKNAYRFLKKGGIAVLDFIGLSYWYLAEDGMHWQSYNPYSIDQLVKSFSTYVIIPVGNWFQGGCNYYSKLYWHNPVLRRLLIKSGEWFGNFDKNPISAIHYLAVAKK